MALNVHQTHPTLWAQYCIDLATIRRQNGFHANAPQQSPQYVVAEQQLDNATLRETVRLNGIDHALAQQQAQVQAAPQPAPAPHQPAPPRIPAVPMAPHHRFWLGLMAFVAFLVLVGVWLHFQSLAPVPTPGPQQTVPAPVPAPAPAPAPRGGKPPPEVLPRNMTPSNWYLYQKEEKVVPAGTKVDTSIREIVVNGVKIDAQLRKRER